MGNKRKPKKLKLEWLIHINNNHPVWPRPSLVQAREQEEEQVSHLHTQDV